MKSLVGRRFGRLKVVGFAGFGRGVSCPFWCCLCDCGNTCRVEGRYLLGTKDPAGKHKQISCGCARADPQVRRQARLTMPRQKRVEICRTARRAVRRRSVPYSMDAHRAAELLGVSVERVAVLVTDGILAGIERRGALWVSSEDVAGLISSQERARKRCTMELAGIARSSARRLKNSGLIQSGEA